MNRRRIKGTNDNLEKSIKIRLMMSGAKYKLISTYSRRNCYLIEGHESQWTLFIPDNVRYLNYRKMDTLGELFEKIDNKRIRTFSKSLGKALFENCVYSLKVVGGKGLECLDYAFCELQLGQLDLSELKSVNAKSAAFMLAYSYFYDSDEPLILNGWRTDKITDMEGMLLHCDIGGFENYGKLDMSSLNTKNVVDMSKICSSCTAREIILDGIDTSNVKYMDEAFKECKISKGSLKLWKLNTMNLLSMGRIFEYINCRKVDIHGWNTVKVTNMERAFFKSNVKEIDASFLDTRSLLRASSMFEGSMAASINIRGTRFGHMKVGTRQNLFKDIIGRIKYDRRKLPCFIQGPTPRF